MNLVKAVYLGEQSVVVIGDIVNQDESSYKLWPYIISKDGGEYEGVADTLMSVEKELTYPLKETSLFEVYMEYADTVQTRQKKQPQIQLDQQTT